MQASKTAGNMDSSIATGGSSRMINDGNNNNSNKRHCPSLTLLLTDGTKRVPLEIPSTASLAFVQNQACQLFGLSSCTLKRAGVPPFMPVNDISSLQNRDKLLVDGRAPSAAVKPTPPPAALSNAVIDLTETDDEEDFNDNDDDEVEIISPSTTIPRTNQASTAAVTPSATSRRLPFGTFTGRDIYRNKIAPTENFEGGFVRLADLILPHTSHALATTFGSDGEAYIKTLFAGIECLLVVTPSDKDELPDATIGNGVLEEMSTNRKWHWLKTRPHTGGCLHAKLFLFRSTQGLRVVVSGNNLFQHQQERQRDCIWIQDFALLGDDEDERNLSDSDEDDNDDRSFERRLRSFVQDTTKCAASGHQATVMDLLNNLLHRICFYNHQAELVFSFPRERSNKGADRGGFDQLAQAVRASRTSKGMSPTSTGGVAYATAGSLGNLEPHFLCQMQYAMQGIVVKKKKEEVTWGDVDGSFRCFWPSITMAKEMDLMGLVPCMRPMPQSHVSKIPRAHLRKVFHEFRANPATKIPTEYSSGDLLVPATHAKFIFCDQGVLYVGSHNLSKAAWGMAGAMPRNLELGVVMASPNPRQHLSWQERLPTQLVDRQAVSPASHKLYVGSKCKELQEGHPHLGAFLAHLGPGSPMTEAFGLLD